MNRVRVLFQQHQSDCLHKMNLMGAICNAGPLLAAGKTRCQFLQGDVRRSHVLQVLFERYVGFICHLQHLVGWKKKTTTHTRHCVKPYWRFCRHNDTCVYVSSYLLHIEKICHSISNAGLFCCPPTTLKDRWDMVLRLNLVEGQGQGYCKELATVLCLLKIQMWEGVYVCKCSVLWWNSY